MALCFIEGRDIHQTKINLYQATRSLQKAWESVTVKTVKLVLWHAGQIAHFKLTQKKEHLPLANVLYSFPL